MYTLILAIALLVISFYFQTFAILKYYKKYDTVSRMYALPENRKSFMIGLVITGILQILFAYSLKASIPDNSLPLTLGQLTFAYGGVGGILLGLFSLEGKRLIHLYAAFQYWLGLAVGAFIISYSLLVTDLLKFTLFSIIFAWVAFSIFQIPRKNPVYAIETSHVLLSYLWIFLIAFTQL